MKFSRSYKRFVEMAKAAVEEGGGRPYSRYHLAVVYCHLKQDIKAIEQPDLPLKYHAEIANLAAANALLAKLRTP